MFTNGNINQKTVGIFIMRTITSLTQGLQRQNILNIIKELSQNRETYYIADLLFILNITGISPNTSNVYSILQLGLPNSPSNVFRDFDHSLQNQDFYVYRNVNLLKCRNWQAIVLNLAKYTTAYQVNWTMNEFKHDFLGVFISSRERKKSAIQYTWNIINNAFGNLPNMDENHALTMFVIAHCSLSYNFFIQRNKILDIARQISLSNMIPVIAVTSLSRLKKCISDIRLSQNTNKLERFIINSYLGINCLPAHIPSNPNQNVLNEEIFQPLELRLAASNMVAPKQFHLDTYPTLNIRNGPDDAKTRNPQRYQRYKLAYESKAVYQQWFIVIYKDYAQPGNRIPSYEATLHSFPDLIFFYSAKCLQRVSHGHAIIITRNVYTTDIIIKLSSVLFGTRDILASPLHGDTIGQAMDYIRFQATEKPVEYNPGLLTKNIPVFKSSQAVEHNYYMPGRKIFRMVSMGMVPYECRNYITRDMVNPIAGLRSRYKEFWTRYSRVILARFNSLKFFYRYPQVEIVRLPQEDYFEEANRWCEEHHFVSYIVEIQNGQLQWHSYLCEPVIVIQDRDNRADGVDAILEMLIQREGVFINLEVVICRSYEGDLRILSTSSSDDNLSDNEDYLHSSEEEEDYYGSVIPNIEEKSE